MMKVIAISGKAQHGKDTFGSLLYNELLQKGKRVIITHYADLVKYIAKTFFNWDGNKDEHGRTILQYVGTDVVRRQRPDYWVNFIVDILSLFGDNWEYVLIPDARFPNEIDILKDSGFNVESVRVVRPEFDNGLTNEQKNHPSETAMDDYEFDHIVYNSGDLVMLQRQAEVLIQSLED